MPHEINHMTSPCFQSYTTWIFFKGIPHGYIYIYMYFSKLFGLIIYILNNHKLYREKERLKEASSPFERNKIESVIEETRIILITLQKE